MPAPLRDMPQAGIELIKAFEGIPDGDPSTVKLDPYLDPLDIWTIGWGHAVTRQGVMLRGAANRALARSMFPGGITVPQAETLLRADLLSRTAEVLRLVKPVLNDDQFAALMSFVFNCGVANFAGSTLLKRLNGGDTAGAAEQFLVWNKGRKNGVLVELPGLTRRRRAERALFLGQDWRGASTGFNPVPAARSRSAAVPLRMEMPEAPTAAEARSARRAAGLQATRPNHHSDKVAASSTNRAPKPANKAVTSVSLRSTTMRELSDS